MKYNLVLFFVVLLGLILLTAAGLLWYLSDTAEFTRIPASPPRLSQ